MEQQHFSIPAVQAEVAKHLSPENENVKQGDIIASIRDMAQVMVTSRDNAAEALAKLNNIRDCLEILADATRQYEMIGRAPKWWLRKHAEALDAIRKM